MVMNRRSFQRTLCAGLTLPLMSTSIAAQPATEKTSLKFVTANNEFAIALYREIESSKFGENLFVSPFSIEAALMMTAEGARSETAAEMGKALRFPIELQTANAAQPWDLSTLRQEFSALSKQISAANDPHADRKRNELQAQRDKLAAIVARANELLKQQKFRASRDLQSDASKLAAQINLLAKQVDQYDLRIANAIWAEKTMRLNSDFVRIVTSFYGTSGAFPVDFISQPEEQRVAINQWISERTEEKIKDVVPKGLITAMTRMVLANAIYFKGSWASPFDAALTMPEPFASRDRTSLTAPMMSQQGIKSSRYGAFRADGSPFATPVTVEEGSEEQAGYPDSSGFQMVELPYNGDRITMLVLLPRRADGLDKLSSLLSSERLRQWDKSLAQREFRIKLPRFKLETEYSLKDPLMRLGMVRAFDGRPGVANFSGLCDSRDPDHQLFISAVLHKAFVEVNEKGTEAAAATVVMMEATGAPLRRPFVPSFIADHPFLFLIRDKQSGAILFIGKVEVPR